MTVVFAGLSVVVAALGVEAAGMGLRERREQQRARYGYEGTHRANGYDLAPQMTLYLVPTD